MFNLANILTASNLISGIIAILLALLGRIDLAPFAIIIGALFDFLDGFIARKMNTAGEMGKQLDSLADMVTFGVAPGIIMMVIMTIDVDEFFLNPYFEIIRFDFMFYLESILNGATNDFSPFIALTIPFLSIFRLAKFNIDKRQSESFIGLPTPASTLFFMTFPLILAFPSLTPSLIIPYMDYIFHPVSLSLIIILISIMMVAELPLFSLKFKTFDWQSNNIRYIFLLISIGFILLFKSLSISLIVFLYLILSFIQNKVIKKEKNEI